MTGRKRGVPRAAAFAVLGGSVLGVAATGSTATADMIDGGTPGVLTIEAMPGTIELILDPGEHGSWLLTPRLDSGGGGDGELTLVVTSEGRLMEHPGGVELALDECSVEWDPAATPDGDPNCAGAVSALIAPTAFAAIDPALAHPLGTLLDGGERHLLLTLSFPDPAPAELRGAEGRFTLRFDAAGDSVTVDTDPPGPPVLETTGVALAAPLGLAVILTLVGAVLTAADRKKESR